MRTLVCNGSRPRARIWCLLVTLMASAFACSEPAETPTNTNHANLGGTTQDGDDAENPSAGGQGNSNSGALQAGGRNSAAIEGSGGASGNTSSRTGAGGTPGSARTSVSASGGLESDSGDVGGAAGGSSSRAAAGMTSKGGRGGRSAGGNKGIGGDATPAGGTSSSVSSTPLGGTKAGGGTRASGGAVPSGGTSQSSASSSVSACPHLGHVTYSLAQASSPTAEQQTAYAKIIAAMDTAVKYYNCYTDITKTLNVSYVPSVQTADGNSNGSIRFGSTASMNHVTAMHEISHTVGIGTASKWASMVSNGVFTGANAKAEVALHFSDSGGVVHADTQHFWPGGLNYESEGKNESDLIAHCEMVVAIRKDLGLN